MSWWKKILLGFVAFVFWMAGAIIMGERGQESGYFWASIGAVAIGFAVAPFWRLRKSIWYWPTVGTLVVINIAVLFVMGNYVARPELPSKGVVLGLLVADCMACWLLMLGMAYLFDPTFTRKDGEGH